MSGFLFWLVACVLFFMAVACVVLGALLRGDEHRYLSWFLLVAWAVLCVGLALVVRAGLF